MVEELKAQLDRIEILLKTLVDAMAGEDEADDVQYDLEGAPLFAERDQGDML